MALAACTSACSAGYILRAGYEEAKILWRRQPIEDILAREDLPEGTRQKLELVLDVRRFARQTLHLRVGGSYASLAHVDADQIVHVVSAAYPLRLQSHTWWFPIVGRVPYKGFFAEAAAEGEAKALRRKGLDTYVRPSIAFSTLGWFDDPLLSPMLRYDPVALANTVLHELTHNTLYLPGQAYFNESFATFVGHCGATLYFTVRQDPGRRAAAARAWLDAVRYSEFLGRLVARMEDAYARKIGMDERSVLFDEARAEFDRLSWSGSRPPRFGTPEVNNAVLLHERLYADRLALFQELLVRNGDDLPHTITDVLEHVDAHPQRPFAALQELLPAG